MTKDKKEQKKEFLIDLKNLQTAEILEKYGIGRSTLIKKKKALGITAEKRGRKSKLSFLD